MTTIATLSGRLAVISLVALGAAACASSADPNSFGAKLAARGGDVQGLGEQWLDGDEKIARGKEMIEDGHDNVGDGEDMVAKGRRQISDGENLIRAGQRAKAEAELAYKTRIAPEPVAFE